MGKPKPKLRRGVFQAINRGALRAINLGSTRPGSVLRLLFFVVFFALMLAGPTRALAGDCGGNGQRACCNGDGEFSKTTGACNSGTVYVNGCNDPNGCSCSGGIIKSENSLG